jgi:hypothetical protein
MENWRRASSLVGLSLLVCFFFFVVKIPMDASFKIPRLILPHRSLINLLSSFHIIDRKIKNL